jgi:hypothetical protein
MKPIIIASLFCLSAVGSYAQSNNTDERQAVHQRALKVYERTNGNMHHSNWKTTNSDIQALYPEAPVNAVPATPSSPYVALQNPPCYKYVSRRGLKVMECPGARFLPEGESTDATARNLNRENTPRVNRENSFDLRENNGNLDVQRQNTYMGYYNNLQSLYPEAPKNAVPAWPSSPHTEIMNPPCYSYTNKRGIKVMECPGARFEPEHDYR